MKEIVIIRNDITVTDSKIVAEYFEKQHKNVLRDIENIISDLNEIEENAPLCDGLKNEPVKQLFIKDSYVDAKGESRKMYWLTEDGFTLLAMGFTGTKALKVKLAFIAEFNRMRDILRNRQSVAPKPNVADAVDNIARTSQALQSLFEIKKGIAISKAIALVELNSNINLEPVKALVPPADHEVGLLNPTQLGKLINNISAVAVNKTLCKLGLQKKVGDKYTLTDKGKQFGEMIPYTNKNNGHTDYRPMWSPTVVSSFEID